MEGEDLLKILLIALFLLPGLLGKKKKKEENHQPYDTRKYEYEDPFKDFENDDYSYEETFETQPVSKPVQYQSIDVIPQEEGSSVFTKEQIAAALASIARQEANQDDISQNEIRGIENEIKTDNNKFLDDFDAQKALIYSEIISPKYLG
jgi:hypothetical protein